MKKVLFYLVYLLSPVLLIHTLYMANTVKYENMSLLISMLIGVMAYTWFIWQFVLSARPKFIELYIGLDKGYRLHGIMALVAIGFVLGHKTIVEWFFSENWMTFIGSSALAIYIGVSVISVIVVTKDRWLQLRLLKRLGSLMKVYKYETNKWLHNLTFIALLFMQTHVLMTSSARNSPKVMYVYMGYFLTALIFYGYHKVFKPWMQKEYPCEIVEIKQESDTICTVYFKPVDHQLNYLPGQYGFFTMMIQGRKEIHPFSFSSAPSDSGLISITVKKLGDFTHNIHLLTLGDTITIEGPFGEFSYLNHSNELYLYMIAGGVGITPMISMLRHLRQSNQHRPVVLLWGVRKSSDLLFEGEIREMMDEMNDLTIIPVVSDAPDHRGEKGYIDQKLIEKYLLNTGFQIDHTGFYICGPPILRKNSIRALKQIGIHKKKIHYEAFSM